MQASAAAPFDVAFKLICSPRIEGGYVNDPKDPGGETKYGICKRDFPQLDIAAITLEQAQGIYKSRYWLPVKADELPWPLALFVFDAAINQGVDAASKMLQKAVGMPQDGAIGARTLAAVKRHTGEALEELNARYLALRALRYTGTRNFDRYGAGWFARLFTIALEV